MVAADEPPRRRPAATSACPCSTRCATPRASTCSSSSSRATNCTTCRSRGRVPCIPARPSASTSRTTTSSGTAALDAYRPRRAEVYANTVVACVYNRADDATRCAWSRRPTWKRAAAPSASACRRPPVRATSASSSDASLSSTARSSTSAAHRALELTTLEALAERRPRAPTTSSPTCSPPRPSRAAVDVAPDAIRDCAVAGVPSRPPPHPRSWPSPAASPGSTTPRRRTRTPRSASSSAACRSVVWIVGGLFKGVDVEPLVREATAHRAGGRARSASTGQMLRRGLRATRARHPRLRGRRARH